MSEQNKHLLILVAAWLAYTMLWMGFFCQLWPKPAHAGIDLSGGGAAYLLKHQAQTLDHRLEIEANAEQSAREFMEIAERVRAESAKAAAVLSKEELQDLTDAVKELRYREARRLLQVVMSKLNSGSLIKISSQIKEEK